MTRLVTSLLAAAALVAPAAHACPVIQDSRDVSSRTGAAVGAPSSTFVRRHLQPRLCVVPRPGGAMTDVHGLTVHAC